MLYISIWAFELYCPCYWSLLGLNSYPCAVPFEARRKAERLGHHTSGDAQHAQAAQHLFCEEGINSKGPGRDQWQGQYNWYITCYLTYHFNMWWKTLRTRHYIYMYIGRISIVRCQVSVIHTFIACKHKQQNTHLFLHGLFFKYTCFLTFAASVVFGETLIPKGVYRPRKDFISFLGKHWIV